MATKGSQRRTKSFWWSSTVCAGGFLQHHLLCVGFEPSTPSCEPQAGWETLLPTSFLQTPPPLPRTQVSPTSGHRRQRTAPEGAGAASVRASGSKSFLDGCSTRGGMWEERHTDRGQKSHQIIGKQRACNNEKGTDFVTNHFFL